MTLRTIIGPDDLRLVTPCRPVTEVNGEVREIVTDLRDTLAATTGVGLAAPQLGVGLRIFIYDAGRHSEEEEDRDHLDAKALINPVVVRRWGETTAQVERCKSIPGIPAETRRYNGIEVRGLDEHGNDVVVEAEGFEAVVLQHELDHLDGRLVTGPGAGDIDYQGPAPTPWQEANLAQIALRLRPGVAASQGLVERRSRSGYELLTVKEDSQIQLYFAAAGGQLDVSGIMSRVDLDRPLYLLGIYTRAMMAALMWKPDARRVYHIGFGGGRIPMVLHHYFPETVIESTEIDAEVVRVARRWFGVQTDERMLVFTEEGRGYLARQPPDVTYDFILVDCFTGSGQHPYSLSTREFYELTRSHLASGGVVATNLVASDPMFEQKIATMQASFAHVWRFETEGADVFFGSDEQVSLDGLRENAEQVFRRAPFTFPFVELLDDLHECPPAGSAEVLTDGQRVEAAADDLMFKGVGRNDPCPCGSGKKFKNCHGR